MEFRVSSSSNKTARADSAGAAQKKKCRTLKPRENLLGGDGDGLLGGILLGAFLLLDGVAITFDVVLVDNLALVLTTAVLN